MVELLDLTSEFLVALEYERPRDLRTWAEEEIVLPNGPLAGRSYTTETMPFQGLILDALSAEEYQRYRATGPTQSGKTLIFLQMLVLYYLTERAEDVILGAPTGDLAESIWRKRILPVLQRTKYRDLLPQTGPGSRGGVPEDGIIELANGASINLMGAKGGDAQRSSDTARVVVLTETDKYDTSRSDSKETHPIGQIEARSDAFEDSVSVGECTVSTEEGWIYQEVWEEGTHHQVYVRCPLCGEHVWPGREGLSGWRGAETAQEARDHAHYRCPSCDGEWDRELRMKALEDPLLVGDGQTVEDGQVVGDLKRTPVWSVRWNAMHSPFRRMEDIAEKEWRAEREGSAGALERELCQYIWVTPYAPSDVEALVGLTQTVVSHAIGEYPGGYVPEGTRVTACVDPGLHTCWWAAVAWGEDRRGWVIDYDREEVPQDQQTSPELVLGALRSIRTKLDSGWRGGVTPRCVFVDTAWKTEIMYRFCRESGSLWLAYRGEGTDKDQDSWRPPKECKEQGRHWYTTQKGDVVLFHGDVDWAKENVQLGFLSEDDEEGALRLYDAPADAHRQLARHVTAERQVREFVPGSGSRVYWHRSRANHWLDCLAGCLIAESLVPQEKPRGRSGKQQRTSSGGSWATRGRRGGGGSWATDYGRRR